MSRRRLTLLAVLALVAVPLAGLAAAAPASAAPMQVSVAGNFGSEVGCAADWDPTCAQLQLSASSTGTDRWTRTLTIPAGTWEYALWADGAPDTSLPNRTFTLSTPTAVVFVYDDVAHRVASSADSEIVTFVGSFQSELGCPSDWQPDCLETLATPDSSGALVWSTVDIPVGAWEIKATHDLTWAENYGGGGVANGPNIVFQTTRPGQVVTVRYDPITHETTVTVEDVVTLPGDFQSEIGCAGDWEPGCQIARLRDSGSGTMSWATDAIPAGMWEVKVAHGLSWTENYGAAGVAGGPEIPFTTTASQTVVFDYVVATHVLTVTVESTSLAPDSSSATPGGSLSGSARGFRPSEAVSLSLGGVQVFVGTADAAGRFDFTLAVPSATASGGTQLVATGSASGRSATSALTVVPGAGAVTVLPATGDETDGMGLFAVALIVGGVALGVVRRRIARA